MNAPSSSRRTLIVLVILAVLGLLGISFYFLRNKKDIDPVIGDIRLMEILYPERGTITDRYGKLVAGNESVYDLMLIPSKIKAMDTAGFCRLLGISRQVFDARINKAKTYSADAVSIFEKRIPAKKMWLIRQNLTAYPGFYERERRFRQYPDSAIGQVLGYTNMVSPQALEGAFGYSRPGDPAGRSGIELTYDSLLRGKRGIRNDPSATDDVPMQAGKQLVTTIDLELQKLAVQLMKNKIGSIVAIEPSTGEILAYLSSPLINPSLLTGPDTRKNLRKLRADSNHVLLNRPIQSRNSPGSSLKPAVALIALQQGFISPADKFYCPAYYLAGEHRVNCEHFDGMTALRKGIAQSCNTYFCHLFEKQMKGDNQGGTRAAFENWRNLLSLFGLGNKLGIDLPNEKKGNLPNASLYDKLYGSHEWGSNDIISLAIGQGELEVTPLQLVNIQCIIANRGYYFTPHLGRGAAGRKFSNPEWTSKHLVGIDPKHFECVLDGMQDVVENGTAVGISIPRIAFVGKTGTVQNTKGKSHSVFAGFAPRNRPEIAIVVVVENAGYGASFAAPIASYLVEKYLKGKVTKPVAQVKWMMDQNLMPMLKNNVDVGH